MVTTTGTTTTTTTSLVLDIATVTLSTTWPIGVALELVSTMSGTVGKQLIRFSEVSKSKGRKSVSRLAFGSGLALNTLLGPVIDVCAYAFAPASLLAPFGGLDIVWNMLSAPFTLGEKLTGRRCCSIVLIFAATFGSVFPADHTEVQYTTELLHELLVRWRTLIYIMCFVAWLAISFIFLIPSPKGSLTRGFALGATAGSIAGNMFCVKAAAELVKTSFEFGFMAVWADWLPWAVVLCAILFAVSNVFFMTKGLQEYQALFMVTLYEGSMIVSNALSATVILGELDGKTTLRMLWYCFCILTIMFALGLLVSGENITLEEASSAGEDEEEEETDEEASLSNSRELEMQGMEDDNVEDGDQDEENKNCYGKLCG